MEIPYQLVSMAAIIRDFDEPEYLNDEHYKLTSVADFFYNACMGDYAERANELLPEYKAVYDKYGLDYFEQVLDDMYAIDGQITSAAKEDELLADYIDRLHSGVTASTKVTATEDNSYAHNLVRISGKDAKYALSNLNKSKKTLGLYGVPGDKGYYVSEFEEATPGFMWASDAGLQILDDAGIPYTRIEQYKIESSKKIKASDNLSSSVFSPETFDVYNALLPYVGKYSSNTGWTGSCELQKVGGNTTAVDGYSYDIVWDDGHDIDSFIWLVNDNPRVGGDYTLMAMYAHGMPDFCDSEKDFYRAIRNVFGNGLKKIGN